MNWTNIDRFLLLVVLGCVATLGERMAFAACEDRCQNQQNFAYDWVGKGVVCSHYEYATCVYCVNASLGACYEFVGAPLPKCNSDGTTPQRFKYFSPCNVACPLPPGGTTQALDPAMLPQVEWTSLGEYVIKCQQDKK